MQMQQDEKKRRDAWESEQTRVTTGQGTGWKIHAEKF
jgi:hypothetical protein